MIFRYRKNRERICCKWSKQSTETCENCIKNKHININIICAHCARKRSRIRKLSFSTKRILHQLMFYKNVFAIETSFSLFCLKLVLVFFSVDASCTLSLSIFLSISVRILLCQLFFGLAFLLVFYSSSSLGSPGVSAWWRKSYASLPCSQFIATSFLLKF